MKKQENQVFAKQIKCGKNTAMSLIFKWYEDI
jgi:hypothetical protein